MASIHGDDGTPSGFNPQNPYGVWGDSGGVGPFLGGNGVVGSSALGSGVYGHTASPQLNAAGVYGTGAVGVAGAVHGANTLPGGEVAVYGTGSNGASLGGIGVQGVSDKSWGVYGLSQQSTGVFGLSATGAGVIGVSGQRIAVVGVSNGTALFAWGGSMAGQFLGNVDVSGQLTKAGGGFCIDHPLDPENRELMHSFVESPDRKNVYDGVAILDEVGQVEVQLPPWFEALNEEFRYQLTALGAPAPSLHIAREISGNRFAIAGGAPGQRVCWQVTGIRHDAWARSNQLAVEIQKPEAERSFFRQPEAHGHGPERSVLAARHPEAPRPPV
jgi:hypothetical protein